MLNELFKTVIDMSLAGAAVILLVLPARLLLRKAPRGFSYALWAVALVRLLCPFTIPSPLSLIPSARIVDVPGVADTSAEIIEVSTGIPAADSRINAFFADHPYTGYVPGEFYPEGPLPVVPQTGDTSDWRTGPALVWAAGSACMLAYTAVSLLLLRRRLVGAVPLEGEPGVWLADHADAPFVLGLFRPKIYVPSSLPESERRYILLHERAHIHRLDQVTRALAWLALCLHWFDPLVWLAFRLAGRDMEASCDEAALRRAEGDIRADYAKALLRLSAGKRLPAGPLAFGDGDPKDRIKNILNRKKPALWVILVSLAAVVTTAAALVTERPFANPDSPFGGTYRTLKYIYMDPGQAGAEYEGFTLTASGALSVDLPDGGIIEVKLEPVSPYDCFREYRHEEYWTGGRDLTVSLRQDSYAAWRGLRRNDNRFWYLLQQKDGALYLASGWYDTEGETDPASDDSFLYWIALLTETAVQDGENGETAAGPGPAAAELQDIGFQLNGNGLVAITGLDCGREPTWRPPEGDDPGRLFADAPFFLNDYFRENKHIVYVCWTDEEESAIGVSFFSASSNPQALSTIPANFTVDLVGGTAEVTGWSGIYPEGTEPDPYTFTEEEMVNMGNVLAELIRGAEEYYAGLPNNA